MLLCAVYGQEHSSERDNDWRLQLELSKVAKNYLYPAMYETATQRVEDLLNDVTDPLEICTAIMHI